MKFNFHNPFHKALTPSQQMVADIKVATIGSIQSQLSTLIMGIVGGVSTYKEQKKYRIIMKGKAVEEVHADPKKEEEEQDSIYSEFMSVMNGDPDIVYDIPPEIEINAFDNDSRTEEERDEIYNIIDAINEANDINRDGTYRTPESVRKEEEESRQKASAETNRSQTTNIREIVAEIIKPIVNTMVVMFTSIVSLIMISKVSDIIDKI